MNRSNLQALERAAISESNLFSRWWLCSLAVLGGMRDRTQVLSSSTTRACISRRPACSSSFAATPIVPKGLLRNIAKGIAGIFMEQVALSTSLASQSSTGSKLIPSSLEKVMAKGSRRPTVLQELTNTVTSGLPHQTHALPSSSLIIDSSSFTVPTPTPATAPPAKLSYVEDRRLRRYSVAEEALSMTFRRCSTSASPQELQIRTLERATALLSARAEDAKEHAAKLKKALADKVIEPDQHVNLKKQRWLEEKRKVAVDEEKKAVNQLLVSLRKSHSVDGSMASSGLEPRTPLTPKMKRQANLAKFFEMSRGQAPMHPHRNRPNYVERTTKRMTSADVSPFKLRTTFATVHDFTIFDLRSLSVKPSASAPSSQSGRKTSSIVSGTSNPEDHQILEAVEEDCDPNEQLPERALSPSPSPAPTLTTWETEAESLHCATPLSHRVPLPKLHDLDDDVSKGTALIFSPSPIERPLEEILADVNVKDLQVSIPDYALQLLDKFGTAPGHVHFPLGTSVTPSRHSTSSFASPNPRSSQRRSAAKVHNSLDNHRASPPPASPPPASPLTAAPVTDLPQSPAPTPVPSSTQSIDSASARKSNSRRPLRPLYSISESISSCVGAEAVTSQPDLPSLPSSASSFVQVFPLIPETNGSPSSLAAKIKRRFSFKPVFAT